MTTDDTTRQPSHCPTCGATVRVLSSDEGTHSYTPVSDESTRQASLPELTYHVVLRINTLSKLKRVARSWVPASLRKTLREYWREKSDIEGYDGTKYWDHCFAGNLSLAELDLILQEEFAYWEYNGEQGGQLSNEWGAIIPDVRWSRSSDYSDELHLSVSFWPSDLDTPEKRASYNFGDWDALLAHVETHYGIAQGAEGANQ